MHTKVWVQNWGYKSMGTGMGTKFQSSGAVWKPRWTSWAPIPNKPTVAVKVKQHFNQPQWVQKSGYVNFSIVQSSGAVWKSRWPSWVVHPNEPYSFCGRKATLKCFSTGHNLFIICQPTSEDMKLYFINFNIRLIKSQQNKASLNLIQYSALTSSGRRL